MSTSGPTHFGAFRFLVTIEGVPVAAFSECVLPSASVDVIEYREGNEATSTVHKLPGLVRYTNLTLKRGIPSAPSTLTIWDWFSALVTGTGGAATIKTVTVTLLDAQQAPVVQWTFKNCWPVKYEMPILNGKTSDLAIETLELAVDGFTMTSPA